MTDTASPTKILVIDDDKFLCKMIALCLDQHDYNCRIAYNGIDGIDLFHKDPPDLVLLDIMMPGMSGGQVLQKLFAEAPETPVVIVSGTEEPSDIVNVLRHGAWDFIIKPIDDMAFLLHTVRSVLEKAKLLRESQYQKKHLEEEVARRTMQVNRQAVSLQKANEALHRKNVALNEILDTAQEKTKKAEQAIFHNLKVVVGPMLLALKQGLSHEYQESVSDIESAIEGIMSPTVSKLSNAFAVLTPREIRICQLIRQGLGIKEAAQIECVAPDTLRGHRRTIRRKLGLANKKVNLRTFLIDTFGEGNGETPIDMNIASSGNDNTCESSDHRCHDED